MKKSLILGSVAACAASVFASVPTIREGSVSVSQDSSHRVLVDYALDDGPAIVTFDVLTNGVSIGAENVSCTFGDVNRKVASGAHSFRWQPTKSWPGHFFPAGGDVSVSVKVTAWDPLNPPDVMVVDLVAKSNITYFAALDQLPGGVSNRIYKTDKLVLRKIPAENVYWRMGSPTTETGYNQWLDVVHNVTLTRDYYIGVYEVTQRQWHWMQGTRPSYFKNPDCWETRPVEKVLYCNDSATGNDIRGNNSSWPTGADPHAVKAASFMGHLRSHSGVDGFDLPTDAQFEFACRAGSPTAYYNRLDYSFDTLKTLARFSGNSGFSSSETIPEDCDASMGTAEVGSYVPNSWGLYDMLGNVAEWCIDTWRGSLGTEDVVDPVGAAASGNTKLFRGGSFREPATTVRCGGRGYYDYSKGYSVDSAFNYWTEKDFVGFRVCLTLE